MRPMISSTAVTVSSICGIRARACATGSEVLKPGGYLIVTVPDEDLYEQGSVILRRSTRITSGRSRFRNRRPGAIAR